MRYAAVLALILALFPHVGQAHSILRSSTPADGAVLAAAPDELALQFGKGIRLTALGVGGDPVDLPAQSGFGTEFAIPLPALTPGTHDLVWRGLSVDGHAMKGTLTFTVE